MVAYSFQTRFIPAMLRKEKQQTIRLPRKRHARIGEAVQHFTGPRMKPIRLGAGLCGLSAEIRLDFGAQLVEIDGLASIGGDEPLNAFAIRDGFRPPAMLSHVPPWEYMTRWWKLTHPDQPVFGGQLIDWGFSFEAMPLQAVA